MPINVTVSDATLLALRNAVYYEERGWARLSEDELEHAKEARDLVIAGLCRDLGCTQVQEGDVFFLRLTALETKLRAALVIER